MERWLEEALDGIASQPVCGYYAGQAPASEPTALAAIALAQHGRSSCTHAALDYLRDAQNSDGSVGVRREESQPAWPTALAILAWKLAPDLRYDSCARRGENWLLTARGKTMARTNDLGHDTTLVGWPWAAGTHSWIEPTAFAVLALKAIGQSHHPRTREAVRLLVDRQISGGGCNYGNTTCLGQTLLPHIQPTGIALTALAGEADDAGNITASLKWLSESISEMTPTTSLCWALIGLRAHALQLDQSLPWLQTVYQRVRNTDRSPYKTALIVLAAANTTSLTSYHDFEKVTSP